MINLFYSILILSIVLILFYFINKNRLKKQGLSFWFMWTLINSPDMLDHLSYWFNLIEWMFWVWKSTFMTYLALLASNRPNTIVFSNIKLNIDNPRVKYFDDNDLDSILDVCYYISLEQNNPNLVDRKDRIKFYVFLDEWAVIFNSTSLKEYKGKYKDSNLENLLYQLRKINVYTLIGIQRPNRLLKMLRENVDQVFYFKPLIWENEDMIWKIVGKFIWQYRKRVVDWDLPWYPTMNMWTPENPKYYDKRVWWLWKPSIFPYYDDLYINTKYVKPSKLDDDYNNYLNEIKTNYVKYKNKNHLKSVDQMDLEDLNKLIKDIWFEKLL